MITPQLTAWRLQWQIKLRAGRRADAVPGLLRGPRQSIHELTHADTSSNGKIPLFVSSADILNVTTGLPNFAAPEDQCMAYHADTRLHGPAQVAWKQTMVPLSLGIASAHELGSPE